MIKKVFLLIFIGFALYAGAAGNVRAYESEYKDRIGFEQRYTEAYDFKKSNGNARLTNKTLADIERANKSTVHYDSQVQSDYMCDWEYERVLDRWVCKKNYEKAYAYTHPQPVSACPFGYQLNYGRTDCIKIDIPLNARLNSAGDGWVCNPGYFLNITGTVCLGSARYGYLAYQSDSGCGSGCGGASSYAYQQSSFGASGGYAYAPPQPAVPSRLPQTGPGAVYAVLTIVFSVISFFVYHLRCQPDRSCGPVSSYDYRLP